MIIESSTPKIITFGIEIEKHKDAKDFKDDVKFLFWRLNK